MKIETVKGSIKPEELGITLPHEHLISDFTNWFRPPMEASKIPLIDAKINLGDLSELRRNSSPMKDNLRLLDVGAAIEELKAFKVMGGNSLVELTLPGVGRDILALRRISEYTGINIIAATGWYIGTTHPPIVKQKSMEELAEIIIHELVEGIDGTGMKAGIIGELGCSHPLQPDEKKVLQAAANAQKETKACINVHPSVQQRNGQLYLDLIEKEGGNLEKVILSHMDSYSKDEMPSLGMDLDYPRELLQRGATIEYDWFGRFQGIRTPTDRERIAAIVELCNQGYEEQILISNDVHHKIHLTRYSGQGYAYILKYIIPALKDVGITHKQIRKILVENPKRLLSF